MAGYGLTSIFISIIITSIVALAQWFVLRVFLIKLWQWLIASLIGSIVSGILFNFVLAGILYDLDPYESGFLNVLFLSLSSGLFIGIAQSIVLKKHFKGAFIWIPACFIGVIAAVLLNHIVFGLNGSIYYGGNFIIMFMSYLLCGLILSVITGLFLINLIKRNSAIINGVHK